MSARTMADRIKDLGTYQGETDVVSVIRDAIGILAHLIQSYEYCWCQTVPCECVWTLFYDLTDCIETRYPKVAEAVAAEVRSTDTTKERGE